MGKILVTILGLMIILSSCETPLNYPMPIESSRPTNDKAALGRLDADFRPIIDAGWSIVVCRGQAGCEDVVGSFADWQTKTIYIKTAHRTLNFTSVLAHELAHAFMLEGLTDTERRVIFDEMQLELSWCRFHPCSDNWWYAADLPAQHRPVEIAADALGYALMRNPRAYTPAAGPSVFGQEGTTVDPEIASLVYAFVFEKEKRP